MLSWLITFECTKPGRCKSYQPPFFASSAVAPLVVFHHYPFRDLEAHQGPFRFHFVVSRFQIGPATKAIERIDVDQRSGVLSVMELD